MSTEVLVETLYPTYVPWKGKTFAQITSFVQRNQNSNHDISTFLLPNPVTLYRREIADVANPGQSFNQRVALSIDELNRPGGAQMVTTADAALVAGVRSTADLSLPNNQSILGNTCNLCNDAPNCDSSSTSSANVCFTDENKARRRCRSAGMVQNRYKAANNGDTAYFTNTKQLLTSRNRTFAQNQYNYLKQGSPVAIPGSPAAQSNMYAAGGISHCPQSATTPDYVAVAYKPSNSKFATQGNVSSSARIARLNYDTVNRAAALTGPPNFGSEVANELAYGVPYVGYTKKDKVGYPNTQAPVITPSGQMRSCVKYVYRAA